LTIRDNGNGFVVSKTENLGMGLKSMKERAELIDGELIVDSRLGLGTKVILKYPYLQMEI
jgi:two-component system sensor histidine kinase DegS